MALHSRLDTASVNVQVRRLASKIVIFVPPRAAAVMAHSPRPAPNSKTRMFRRPSSSAKQFSRNLQFRANVKFVLTRKIVIGILMDSNCVCIKRQVEFKEQRVLHLEFQRNVLIRSNGCFFHKDVSLDLCTPSSRSYVEPRSKTKCTPGAHFRLLCTFLFHDTYCEYLSCVFLSSVVRQSLYSLTKCYGSSRHHHHHHTMLKTYNRFLIYLFYEISHPVIEFWKQERSILMMDFLNVVTLLLLGCMWQIACMPVWISIFV